MWFFFQRSGYTCFYSIYILPILLSYACSATFLAFIKLLTRVAKVVLPVDLAMTIPGLIIRLRGSIFILPYIYCHFRFFKIFLLLVGDHVVLDLALPMQLLLQMTETGICRLSCILLLLASFVWLYFFIISCSRYLMYTECYGTGASLRCPHQYHWLVHLHGHDGLLLL